MAQAQIPLPRRASFETMRADGWWLQPLLVLTVLSTFVVYSTWAAFQGAHYEWGPYLSPFYSPLLFGDGPRAWFGPKPAWWPGTSHRKLRVSGWRPPPWTLLAGSTFSSTTPPTSPR